MLSYHFDESVFFYLRRPEPDNNGKEISSSRYGCTPEVIPIPYDIFIIVTGCFEHHTSPPVDYHHPIVLEFFYVREDPAIVCAVPVRGHNTRDAEFDIFIFNFDVEHAFRLISGT